MPLDAEAGKLGPNGEPPKFRKERVEEGEGGIRRKIVHFVGKEELEANTRPLYCSHFQTCPSREQHRKS
jgi:hypothetical protein